MIALNLRVFLKDGLVLQTDEALFLLPNLTPHITLRNIRRLSVLFLLSSSFWLRWLTFEKKTKTSDSNLRHPAWLIIWFPIPRTHVMVGENQLL